MYLSWPDKFTSEFFNDAKQTNHIFIDKPNLNINENMHLIPSNIINFSIIFTIKQKIILPEFVESLFSHGLENIIVNKSLKKFINSNSIIDLGKEKLPDTLEELIIRPTKIINLHFPKYLKKLILMLDYYQGNSFDISNLPNIEELHIYVDFPIDFSFLPNSLKFLKISNNISVDNNFENLPNSVEELELSTDYPKYIPSTVKKLTFLGM